MKVIRDETCVLKPGDFGAKIVGADLHIPAKLYDQIEDVSAREDVEILLSFLMTFPSAIKEYTGWSIKKVKAATDALVKILTGHIREELLHPAPPIQHPLGALMSPGWKLPAEHARKSK